MEHHIFPGETHEAIWDLTGYLPLFSITQTSFPFHNQLSVIPHVIQTVGLAKNLKGLQAVDIMPTS